MNNKRWLARWFSGLYCTAALAATITGQLARGQEEAPPLPPDHRVEHLVVFDNQQMHAIERAGEALLQKLGPGFTITVTKTPGCLADGKSVAAGSCNTGLNCAGSVIHRQTVSPDGANHVCTIDATLGCFVKQPCPCAITGECECLDVCHCGTDCACGTECLVSGAKQTCYAKCGEEECDIALAHAEEAAERHQDHFHQRIQLHHEQLDVVHHLVDLVADRAAARTELECRREASAKMADLYETLAELIAANAALEAKLEAQVEHTKTLHKIAELAAENARLKTHVELAGTRSDSSQQMLSLTLENERLKLLLADLEHKHAASEASRTAERSSRDHQSR